MADAFSCFARCAEFEDSVPQLWLYMLWFIFDIVYCCSFWSIQPELLYKFIDSLNTSSDATATTCGVKQLYDGTQELWINISFFI